jgi:hypothetical protein
MEATSEVNSDVAKLAENAIYLPKWQAGTSLRSAELSFCGDGKLG